MTRIGIVGTGFIVNQANQVIAKNPDLQVSKILTRRNLDTVKNFDRAALTNSTAELIDQSDIIFESTGDPIHSTVVVEEALKAGRKVVTMNAELHVTTGSYLAGLGYLAEADGDQPGATAILRNEALGMGFEPLAYVNVKGFLNPNPSREDMEYWSNRQELSLVETTSFTDGTKLHIEQAFCANAFGATIAEDGLIGGQVDDITDTDHLVEAARKLGKPISDYILCGSAPPGVFILADNEIASSLPHYGPYEKLLTKGRQSFILLRPYHLCGLEVAKSLVSAANGAPPLLNNGEVPWVSIGAIAKHDLSTDTVISHAIGGFEVRGSALKSANNPDHVPIGLLNGARIKRSVAAGQTLTFDDVDIPESRALEIWLNELRPRFTKERPAA